MEEVLKQNFRNEVLDDLLNLKGGVFDNDYLELLPLGTAFIINFLKDKEFFFKYRDNTEKAYFVVTKSSLSAGIYFGARYAKDPLFLNDYEAIRKTNDVNNLALEVMEMSYPKDFIYESLAEDVFDTFMDDLSKEKNKNLSMSNYTLAGLEATFLFGVSLGFEKTKKNGER